ncbi:MAG: fimbrial protein [Bacteroidales bacterium]
MRRYLIFLLLIIPFLNSCVSDDCSDCADMAYDTKVKLHVIWPRSLSSNTTKSGNDDIYINNFTLFVFNNDGTLNTVKKVNNPSGPVPYSTSVSMNITSAATYIYAIANCNDLLTASPTSTIAQQVNANMNNLKAYFDSTLSVGVDSLFEGSQLMLTGYTDAIIQNGSNPYQYAATVYLKPIVSKFDIKVSSIGTTPSDYINCIDNIEVFVLNSRSKAKLFSPNTNSPYLHGKYETFWSPYPYVNFGFKDTNNQNSNLSKPIPYTAGSLPFSTTELSIYSPENDTISSLGSQHKTLVVLKIKYKMRTIEGTDEVFYRFLTVPLKPPTGSTLSNKRGTRYTINYTLSGKYFGAMSPLSSMMQPYSPLPYKTTKNLIYVEPEDYSKVKSSEWK